MWEFWLVEIIDVNIEFWLVELIIVNIKFCLVEIYRDKFI